MKILPLLILAAAAFLAGCASTPGDPAKAASAADGTTAEGASPAARPARSGSMKPLAPGNATGGAVAHLTPPADLWERIRRGYRMPDLEGDLVRDREQWYGSRPDYILRMTERSRKYLFYIVEELERRNMPTELALLPFIESAFNPQAVSSAKAAGMWQFMPATGKYFELKQNVFRDDRRDVLESTRAALDYLQKLHKMFGDWHLALAAYNWGEGSVSRAIARNKASGLGLSYAELNMPMETRFYVPKLQAVKNIISQPDAFSARLPQIENHPYFQSVPITRDIDVALAARLAEVRIEDFKALNPSLHRPVILAAGTPQILLPWDNAAIFQRNLEAHGSRLASWTAWVAPTTMRAADAARKVGMDENEFRSLNNIPPRMMVKAGSTLLVPRSEQRDTDVSSKVADNGQVALAPEIVLKRRSVRAHKGDTLASLAQRYSLSAASVANWNKMSAGTKLKKGQSVVVFLPERASVAAEPADSATSGSKSRTGRKVAAAKGKTEGRATGRAKGKARASAEPASRTKAARSAAPTRKKKR